MPATVTDPLSGDGDGDGDGGAVKITGATRDRLSG
jgi:hypothetical protein